MPKLFTKKWATSNKKMAHNFCYYYRVYTEMDLTHGTKEECNAYFYNYLTCFFKYMADLCPDDELVDSPECKEKYHGMWKTVPK